MSKKLLTLLFMVWSGATLGCDDALANAAHASTGRVINVLARHITESELITVKQQHLLFTPIYYFFKNDIIRLGKKPDALEGYGLMSWEDINPKILTVIVDMHYRGDHGPSSRAKLHKLVIENKFEEFYKIPSDPLQWANVPVDRFNRRVEFLK